MDIVSHGLWGALAFGGRVARALAGLRNRPGAGSVLVRHPVGRRRAGAVAAAGFQPWDTAGIHHPTLCASSLQCHP